MNTGAAGRIRRRRLFYAVWPSARERHVAASATATALAQIRGRAVPPERLHLTVAFLGAQPEDRLEALILAARHLSVPPFELHFRTLDYWRRARVVVAEAAEGNAAAQALARELWSRLEALGLAPERRPFLPHLTLAREARAPPEDAHLTPFAWSVQAIVLVESLNGRDGAEYRPLASAPLEG